MPIQSFNELHLKVRNQPRSGRQELSSTCPGTKSKALNHYALDILHTPTQVMLGLVPHNTPLLGRVHIGHKFHTILMEGMGR